jgi:hypothetical protein
VTSDDLHHIRADVRTSLDILRAFRADLRTPARHLPALDTAIAATERALARLGALTADSRVTAT